MRITDARKQKFLDALASSGSWTVACKASGPKNHPSRRPGYNSWLELSKKDPVFAQAVAQAKNDALASVEKTLYDHATCGTTKDVFHNGRIVGTQVEWDHQLLLRVAGKLDSSWHNKEKIEHSGSISADDPGMLVVSAADVLLLPEADQKQLIDIVTRLGDLKDGRKDQGLPFSGK